MDALYEAQRQLVLSESYFDEAERKDGNTYYVSKGEAALRNAGAYASIAQAEQLKRIADCLDVIISEWAKPHYVINHTNK